MPAKSKEQQRLMAMAKHNPSKVYKKNRGVLKMSKKQLGDFSVLDKEQRKQIKEIIK